MLRFLQEGRILSRISHPGVVGHRAHGVTADGSLFLAMDWLDGDDLRAHLAARGMSVLGCLTVARRLINALSVVHQAGVVHRDLKPSNIMLPQSDEKEATLVDFGIASPPLLRISSASPNNSADAIAGTPGYLAPEQIAQGTVSERSDFFSLGCVLFECVTNQPAFRANDLDDLRARILHQPPPDIADIRPDVPPRFASLIHNLLAKNPDDRPSGAQELLDLLRQIETLDRESGLASAGPEPPAKALWITDHERRVVTVVLAVTNPNPKIKDTGQNEAFANTLSVRASPRSIVKISERYGARLDALSDEMFAFIFEGPHTPFERAYRAMDLARDMRRQYPTLPLGIATLRRSESRESLLNAVTPLCETLQRRDISKPLDIQVDEDTTRLLQQRATNKENAAQPALFVGRQQELGTLREALDQCANQRRARAMIVSGEAGLGKTRLAAEFRAWAEKKYGHVVQLDAMASLSPGPYGAVASALKTAWGLHPQSDLADLRNALLRIAATCTARSAEDSIRFATAAFLGELVGVPFPDDRFAQLRAARLDPSLMAERIREAFFCWVRFTCRAGPTLWIIDDIHAADDASSALIADCLQSMMNEPLFVLGLARSETPLPALTNATRVHRLELGRLSVDDSQRLARASLRAPASERWISDATERAQGNAFFLEELIRAQNSSPQRSHATARVSPTGRSDPYHDAHALDDRPSDMPSDDLPNTVLGVIESRLSELTNEARAVLRAGSVLGPVFWQPGIEVLLRADAQGDERASSIRSALDSLCNGDWITKRDSSRFGPTEYAFRHALVRDACYAMLTDRDRVVGHFVAGEWLEGQGEDNPVILAEHFERGDAGTRAVPWFLRAAERFLRANDLRGTIHYAERGVHSGAENELLGELCLRQSEAFTWLGQATDAKTVVLRALSCLTPKTGLWYRAVAELCDACAVLGTPDDTDPWTKDLTAPSLSHEPRGLETQSQEFKHLEQRAAALSRISFAMMLIGKQSLAEQTLSDAQQTYERMATANPLVRGHLEHATAAIRMMQGARERAAAAYQDAAEAFRMAGALRHANGAMVNTGAMYIELGLSRRARDILQPALRAAEEHNFPYSIELARLNLGIALSRSDEPEEGKRLALQACQAFHAQGDRRLEASAHCALAEMVLAEPNSTIKTRRLARAHACRAVRVARGLPAAQAAAYGVLAQTRLHAGQPERALDAATRGMALRDMQPLEERDVLLRLVHAEALFHTGRRDAAREHLNDLVSELDRQAQQIESAEARRAFKQSVPEHHRVHALASAWS